jgi:tetratricopeptide (TPR) repeat protein
MKTAHLNREGVKKPLTEWLRESGALEKDDKERAIAEYKKIAAAYPASEHTYDRLMILYRQQKDYNEELKWIEKAIAVFTKTFNRSSKKPNAKITAISKTLTKSLGLIDKKGKPLYQHQPIARWEKRRELLIKKNK